jgi:hypothetical protein
MESQLLKRTLLQRSLQCLPRTFSSLLLGQFPGPVNAKSSAVMEPPVSSELERDGDVKVEHVSNRKRAKKRRIYCFNCNRQEFHFMAYKGTWLDAFFKGLTFGLSRIVGPYRCTCCGRKRAMYADYCSLSYYWRKWNERRLSRTRASVGRSKRRR